MYFSREILKHSAVYGIGQVLVRSASFLLLPVYTHYLRPADYGCLAILNLTAEVLVVFMTAGMTTAVNRHHFEAETKKEQALVWWTGLSIVALVALLVIILLWSFRGLVAKVALGGEVQLGSYYFSLMLPTVGLTSIGYVLSFYLRAHKWSLLYTSVTFLQMIVNIAFTVYFLAVMNLGVSASLLANLIANVVMTIVLFGVFTWTSGQYGFSKNIAKKLWQFGSPFIVYGMLMLILHQADRYILRLYVGMDEVGIYSLAYTVGQAVNTLILLPFAAIWSTEIYEIAEQPNRKQIFSQLFQYFFDALILIMLAASLVARPLLMIMTSDDYHEVADIVPIICLAYFLFSLHKHFEVPAMLSKQTVSLLLPTSIAVAFNILANVVLIPYAGAFAAAWVSVATFAIYSLVGLARYRMIEKLDYPLVRCLVILVGVTTTFVGWRFYAVSGTPSIVTWALAIGIWFFWAALLFGRQGIRMLLRRTTRLRRCSPVS